VRSIRRVRRPLVALVALLVALAIGYAVRTLDTHDSGSPHPTSTNSARADSRVALSALPPQAADTIALIERGGPFPYPRNDGAVFHNNERLLPSEQDGYYREYTVPTPGSDDRGARRIITGRNGQIWYTGDHYETFERVDVDK
jgi:ribonuclease T1